MIDEGAFDEIEEALIVADVGIETTETLIGSLKEKWKRGQIKALDEIKRTIVADIENILLPVEVPLRIDGTKPFVVLTLGVNGVGKTTTIAKIVKIYLNSSKSVLLGACDTFRAAAIEQLEIWGGRLGVDVIKQKEGSDPAAVAYDATTAAKSRGIDVLILDTAGRLHTKVNLMEEMKKIKKVTGKEIHGAPHETLLIVDATNGQNTIAQAKKFHEDVGITGIVIAKLDSTAKGGFILPIARNLKIPIRFLGVGETIDDLISFSARDFSKALFE
jgi:fused signal recognition particle receptor